MRRHSGIIFYFLMMTRYRRVLSLQEKLTKSRMNKIVRALVCFAKVVTFQYSARSSGRERKLEIGSTHRLCENFASQVRRKTLLP